MPIRRWLGRIAICCIVMYIMAVTAVMCQEVQRETRVRDSTVEIAGYLPIPEAAEQCTIEECGWWIRLQLAGSHMQSRRDERFRKRFSAVLIEGAKNNFRVPLSDRPPQKLVSGKIPAASTYWKSMTNGTVELLVEVKADGSVGEVMVVTGLNKQLDQVAVSEARSSMYLPAVKDRQFTKDRLRTSRVFFLTKHGAAQKVSSRF